MSRFRDRYRLAILRGGKVPRFSLQKRTEPSARILYYHRVNDANDPFFPAMSTALFEAEMRYVRQHYKVVSLSELVTTLQGTSSKPVLAITFDDGYRDNYENAFPILERYGLPATIFLTTGTMDSPEPLWFERLALAFKNSPVEHPVELGIEPGRPFGMRTRTERLESNDRVLELMRGLPDAERRNWLACTLEELRVNDFSARNGKMLTWDQVRLMKKRGIDFGGHTVTHPFLSQMPREQVSWEVGECKRRIEEETQSSVPHFAYPNGRERDFGAWNKEVIREAGYQAAVTTIWGVNYCRTDLMELRRGGPWETTPAGFAYKLDWYQWVNG